MSNPLLIAGGGTGGHVFPGIAVADALRALADVEVVFCGTPRGIEGRAVPARGYHLELLDVAPMKGGGVVRMLKGAAIAARETGRAAALVRRVAPRAVLSMGGYAAGPVALAARAMGVPLAVLEPNSTIGFANKVLAPLSARGYVAWPRVGEAFKKGRARIYGVPLRSGFAPSPYVARKTHRVLVLGGSQGATYLNDRLPDVFAGVSREFRSLEVVHQVGANREARVLERYASLGMRNVTVVPFIDDVAGEIVRADLVVARSGAVAVAEISAIGRAAVLVPFPHAADDHQFENASSLARIGGAVCIRQEAADEARLVSEIGALLHDDGARVRMADASRAHGRPTASMDVARDLLDLAGIPARKPDAGGAEHRMNGSGSSAAGYGYMEVR